MDIVKEGLKQPMATNEKAQSGKVLAEALLVVIAGVGLALAANALSPHGLSLKRDYFPVSNKEASQTPIATNHPVKGTAVVNETVSAALQARLKQDGLKLIDLGAATNLFQDPRYDREMIVFVDARDDDHYTSGHIPGAIQFDRYHPEKYLGAVLTACIPAEQVVVYCTGGECEDSEFAAMTLKDAGVSADKLQVFGGGITEWMAKHLPVETGARRSGLIQNGDK